MRTGTRKPIPTSKALVLLVTSRLLREHFAKSGYFEGRLPAALPFDPQWYRRHYRDIADAFPSADPDAMQQHFLASGYFEGRAGTAEMLAEVERWLALAKE